MTYKTKQADTKRKRTKKKRSFKFILIKYLVILFVLAVASAGILILSADMGVWGKIPSYYELKNIRNSQAAKIFSADGKLIGKYYYKYNRTNISYSDISTNVINALISTEDSRFYEHKGIDRRSMFRVFFKTLLLGDRSSGGGSTLSQQLCKNLYPRKDNILIAKIKESITATKLEKIYSKKEILVLYLNTVPFGEEIYGIESAAQRYFNKHAKNLSVPEAATLVGMLKANTAYNPRINPENAVSRRNTVINQMVKQGVLSNNDANRYKNQPLNIDYRRLDSNTGPATYLRENIRQEISSYLKEIKEKTGKDCDLYQDGLNIYTTIDSDLQEYAEEAVSEHMKELQEVFNRHIEGREPWIANNDILKDAIRKSKRYQSLTTKGLSSSEISKIFSTEITMEIYSPDEGDMTVKISPLDSVIYYLQILHPAFTAADPRNGKILAWVGGLDHKYFKYDMVKAERQTGSVFKPVVYAAALENGESANAYYKDEEKVYEEYNNWTPRNSHGGYSGYYTMKGALAESVNTIAVEVAMKTGLDKVAELADKTGITADIPLYPSMALGTSNISLDEMILPYCVFANNGRSVKTYSVEKITDKAGNIIYQHEQEEAYDVMASENANIINYMLESVVNDGTGRRLRTKFGLRNSIAGKTGTTQNNVDGWFIGYNPHIVAGCRVGAADERVHFRSTLLGQGANTALPIFALFMKKALDNPRFEYWNNIQFPQLPYEEVKKIDIPTFKDNLNLFEKMSNEKLKQIPQNKLEKKKPNIFQRIKNIFRKKKKKD